MIQVKGLYFAYWAKKDYVKSICGRSGTGKTTLLSLLGVYDSKTKCFVFYGNCKTM